MHGDSNPTLTTADAAQIFARLHHLSIPRPNGSRALDQTVAEVRSWLEEQGIPVQAHHFTLRPYFMELLGLWMILTGILLPVVVLAGWGWLGLVLALLVVAIPILETRYLRPTVTALVRQKARNLVVHLPAAEPYQEIVLCAHLDSKTELLDHQQRAALLRLGPVAMGLALVCGLLTAIASQTGPETARLAARWLAFLCAPPLTSYGLAMGANMVGGRLSRQRSSGAVDNGAAVAVLLSLSAQLQRGDWCLPHTSVTLLFSVGEEAMMQGALAYAATRQDWPLPARAINLEILGQNGGYLLWENDGTALQKWPADAELNDALEAAIEAVAGERPRRERVANTDAFAFLRRGIPAATLASYDASLGARGLHSASDHPGRVDAARLAEANGIIRHVLSDLDGTRENH